MAKFKDFDEFNSEAEMEPIKIKIFNNEYIIPLSSSASAILRGYRALIEGRDEVSNEEQMLVMVETLGVENVEEWCKLGLTQAKMFEIYYWVLEQKGSFGNDVEAVEQESGKK